LHDGSKERLSLFWAITASVLDFLAEALTFLSYNYQGGLVFAEGANLVALRRNVILFDGAVTQSLTIEKFGKEPTTQKVRQPHLNYK